MPGDQPTTLLFATDPGRGQGIPYVDQFYDALAPHGVELLETPLVAQRRWLAREGARLGVVHAQWPEDLWNVKLRSLRSRCPWLFRLPLLPRLLTAGLGAYRFGGFLRFVWAAKCAGVRFVWTLHNLEAHEGAGWLDRAGYRVLSKAADLVICHGEWARQQCLDRLAPRGQVIVMRHGNYQGVYPASRPRSSVRSTLGLRDDLPVVCCLGGLREYKGAEIACEAVARLDGQVQLIVAGPPHPSFDLSALARRIDALPGGVLLARRLSDQEFADLLGASDASLLPYRKITTSGMLLASLTLGRGVVGSDLPYLREVLTRGPKAGVLVPANDPDALARGIRSFLARPADQRTKAALALAAQFAWTETIRPVAEVIEQWRRSP